jgi:serine/threonine protein kinase
MLLRYNDTADLKKILKQYSFFKNIEFSLKPLKSDNLCRTFLMEDSNSHIQYVVRINGIASPKSVEKEVKALIFLKSKSNYDWIPKLYFYDHDFNVSVTEYYPNCVSLANINYNGLNLDIESISKQVYKIVTELHSIKSNEPIDIYNQFYEELKRQLDWAIDYGIITEEEKKTACQFYESNDEFKNITPSFIHSDISSDNLIYNKNSGKIHLIDFEFSKLGNENYDYVHMIRNLNSQFLKDFDNQFKNLKKTNTYILYDYYFALCYYQPNDLEYGNEEMRKTIDQMNIWNNHIRSGNDFDSKNKASI